MVTSTVIFIKYNFDSAVVLPQSLQTVMNKAAIEIGGQSDNAMPDESLYEHADWVDMDDDNDSDNDNALDISHAGGEYTNVLETIMEGFIPSQCIGLLFNLAK